MTDREPAPPSDPLAADRAARRAAQRAFDRPLVIEAGAGTGKTATLVARLLAWSLGPGWAKSADALADRPRDPDAPPATPERRIAERTLGRVVAITFTEAAAAEMAARAGDALAQVAAGGRPVGLDTGVVADAEAADRGRCLADAIDHLRVTTIHGFCRRLLAEHPFDADLAPGFRVDPAGDEATALAEEVVAAAIGPLYHQPGDADALALAADGVGPPELAAALAGLAARGAPATLFEADPLSASARRALGRRLASAGGRLLLLLEQHLGAPQARRAANAERLTAFLRRLDLAVEPKAEGTAAPDPRALRTLIDDHLPPPLATHLAGWARRRFTAAEAAALGRHVGAVEAAAADLAPRLDHLRRLDTERLGRIRRVLGPLWVGLRRTMAARGIVTFDELTARAANLLSADRNLCRTVRRGIDQVLVDEFQDTDGRQSAIVHRMALGGAAAERPGLFVVGDPKQSIYGWRGADLGAYEGFVAAVEAAGGARLSLTENFRSAPPILDEVTRLLAPVMARRPGVQPAFVPLVPCAARRHDRGDDGAPWSPVEHWVSWPHDPRQQAVRVHDATSIEARALAADLVALEAAGVAWREVAVLVRSTTDLEPYLAAMRAAGIPFRVGRDRHYYRRREVVDAAAAVRAALDPDDVLALLALIRSPAVGVPDAALPALWHHRLPERFARLDRPDGEARGALRQAIERAAAEAPRDLPGLDALAAWPATLGHLADAVARLRQRFHQVDAGRFLDQLRRVLLLDLAEAPRYLGRFRLANLDRFFAELHADLAADDGAGADRDRLLRRLRRRLADAEHDLGPADPATAADDDAVRVLTIHGAKGLQFRHVYLVQTHKGSAATAPPAVEVEYVAPGGDTTPFDDRPSGARGRIEDPTSYRLLGAATLDWDVVEARRRATEAAELVRTLYVAATRAADRLVIAGHRPADAVELARAASHADLLTHRRGPAPGVDQLCRSLADGEAQVVQDGVRWLLLACVPPAPPSVPAAPPPAKGRDPAAWVEAERAAADAARARSARPFRLGASRLAHIDVEAVAVGDDASPAPALPAGDRGSRVGASAATEASPEHDRRRRIAAAAGTLVHLALERFDDASDDPTAELRRQRENLRSATTRLRAEAADGEEAEAACARAATLLDRFAGGDLFARFVALLPRIVARELPVLLPPTDDGPGSPVGFVAGAIDLVHRDPDGSWVIVDYKTDAMGPGPFEPRLLDTHAAAYAAQGAAYTRALTEALDLVRPPRFELWFLDADRWWST